MKRIAYICTLDECNKPFYAKGVCKMHYTRKTLTPEYQAWLNIKKRCYIATSNGYEHYGGRGIVMCDKWLHSFKDFLADLGKRPSTDYSVDRIDVNGNYEPLNCRWATRNEQANNRRNNRLITINGVTRTISGWAEVSGLPRKTIACRVNKKREEGIKLIRPYYTRYR